ncbi:hypothetical protein [Nonomuraea candida]|uniref:hypothetical protein n=1 Tax=Nonomuraea candida TaxID=359159 RepID=UPI0012FA0091|nr:hypothetical protein [Nonomuraea candida]
MHAQDEDNFTYPPTDAPGPATLNAVYYDQLAHSALKNHLFVTGDPSLLGRRMGSTVAASLGVVGPREALTLVEHMLRTRGKVVYALDGSMSVHGSPHDFHSNLATRQLPSALRAYRSAIAPNHRTSLAKVAAHLETLLARQHDLLVAGDELAMLRIAGGWFEQDNSTQSRTSYHLQNSLVLFTGALDSLAWIAADLEGCEEGPAKISWGRFVKSGGWAARLSGPAARMRDAVREKIKDPAIDWILDVSHSLRDAYQHRHPLRTAVLEVLDQNQMCRVRTAVVNLTESTTRPIPTSLPGLGLQEIIFGEDTLVLPDRLHSLLIATLPLIVDNALDAIDWPDADWFDADERWHREAFEQSRFSDLSAWLAGIRNTPPWVIQHYQ